MAIGLDWILAILCLLCVGVVIWVLGFDLWGFVDAGLAGGSRGCGFWGVVLTCGFSVVASVLVLWLGLFGLSFLLVVFSVFRLRLRALRFVCGWVDSSFCYLSRWCLWWYFDSLDFGDFGVGCMWVDGFMVGLHLRWLCFGCVGWVLFGCFVCVLAWHRFLALVLLAGWWALVFLWDYS